MFLPSSSLLILLPLLVKAGDHAGNGEQEDNGKPDFPVFDGGKPGEGIEAPVTWDEGASEAVPNEQGGEVGVGPGVSGPDFAGDSDHPQGGGDSALSEDHAQSGALNIYHKHTEGYCVVALAQQPDSPVVLMPCVDPSAAEGTQSWLLPEVGQKGLIRWGDDFCLDAGLEPHDGGPAKLWGCDESNAWIQQQWIRREDGLLETGNGQCLNVVRGEEGEKRGLQTWSCDAEDPQNRESS